MKHPMHTERSLSLFDTHAPSERGSREWGTFSAVREDSVDAYRVAMPQKPMAVRGPRNILRIITPQFRTFRSAH